MDKYRLLLGILFVTLSWSCMQTYAQDTSNSTSPVTNGTTPVTNGTTPGANATASGANATASGANATASGANATASGANTTTPGANNSISPAGTPTPAPGANTTTPQANNSTSTSVTTVTPAPLEPNTSVETLPTTINRTDCGTKQLCAAEPSLCDPSTDASCFFLGAKKKDGNNFEFVLSGESDGYIAASVLSFVNNKEVTYICANNNNQVKFFGAIREGAKLTLTNVSANSVKGKVNGKKIQCTFLATVPDTRFTAPIRARRATDVTMTVSTGTYNASSDNLGTPNVAIKAVVSDLANPNTTVINEITNSTNATTAPTTATSAAGSSLTDLSRNGCGTEKLCASEPSTCNPATGATCSFLSAKQKSGQIYSFELSGISDGYIASAVSNDLSAGNGDSTYVCANNNGAVKFITAIFDSKKLTQKSLDYNSSSVLGKISGGRIQCIFEATLPDTTTRAAAYSMIIMNGTYTPNSNTLGDPFVLVRTSVLNLSDPAANTTNLGSSGVVPRYHPLMQALLVTIGILVLTIFGH